MEIFKSKAKAQNFVNKENKESRLIMSDICEDSGCCGVSHYFELNEDTKTISRTTTGTWEQKEINETDIIGKYEGK